eukprot:scaffold23146_cov26-Tisochrysis_lutea.AAC.1
MQHNAKQACLTATSASIAVVLAIFVLPHQLQGIRRKRQPSTFILYKDAHHQIMSCFLGQTSQVSSAKCAPRQHIPAPQSVCVYEQGVSTWSSEWPGKWEQANAPSKDRSLKYQRNVLSSNLCPLGPLLRTIRCLKSDNACKEKYSQIGKTAFVMHLLMGA